MTSGPVEVKRGKLNRKKKMENNREKRKNEKGSPLLHAFAMPAPECS
jgi:hypothetical protein